MLLYLVGDEPIFGASHDTAKCLTLCDLKQCRRMLERDEAKARLLPRIYCRRWTFRKPIHRLTLCSATRVNVVVSNSLLAQVHSSVTWWLQIG